MRYTKVSLTVIITLIIAASSVTVIFPLITLQVLAQTVNNRSESAKKLLLQGVELLQSKQIDSARKSLQQALTIYREIQDSYGETAALAFLGMSYKVQRDYNTAINYYQQGLTAARKLPKRDNEKQILLELGQAYLDFKNYPQAIEYNQQALNLARQLKDNKSELVALGRLGRAYSGQRNFAKAIEYYQQTLTIARATKDRKNEVVALIFLSSAYLSQENYATVIDVSKQGLEIAQKISNSAAAIEFLNRLGNAYYYIGDYDKATQYAQQSLNIAQLTKDRDSQSSAFNLLGNIYYKRLDYNKAIEYYQQVLAIARELKDRFAEGEALGNIGLAYVSQDGANTKKALEYLQQDLVIQRELKNRLGEGQTLSYLGGAYTRVGDYNKAIEHYQQSLAIAREVKYTRGQGITLTNLGYLYNEQKKLPEAEKSLRAAIVAFESLRENLGKKDAYKISIFEQQADTYQLLQKVLIKQNKTDEALEISEQGRAKAFLDLLSQRISNKRNIRGTQLSQPVVEKPTLSQLKQIAKQQNATLVEYSIGKQIFPDAKFDTSLYIWVIKPTGEVTFKNATNNLLLIFKQRKTNIGELVASSRESIGVSNERGIQVKPGTNSPAQAQTLKQLHKLLIEPIVNLLPTNPNERVIFIPQDSLFLIPFPALQDEQGKYLIEKHTILTAPSIQVLELTHKQNQIVDKNNSERQNTLVVGNPAMPYYQSVPGKPATKLPPLPGAEKEAIAIAQELNTKAITGNQASKAAITQKLSQARIIHLATHGLLDDYRGIGSAIALAPSSKDDGLLTAEEILDMKINADLVVLSACDTGRGKITGDGVIGLSRSFISAGAPTVVVSLWAVNDDSTVFLMTEFYKHLQQNVDKATALRKAMLATKEKYPSPSQWAAFTLIGEAN